MKVPPPQRIWQWFERTRVGRSIFRVGLPQSNLERAQAMVSSFLLHMQPAKVAGIKAIRDKEANRPFNDQDFEHILMFAERYQNLGKLKYAYAIPNPNGTTESDRWQHISQALLSAVATGILPDPVIIYGRLISAYRSGDVDGFNQVIREYRQYLERAIPQEVKRRFCDRFCDVIDRSELAARWRHSRDAACCAGY